VDLWGGNYEALLTGDKFTGTKLSRDKSQKSYLIAFRKG